MELGVKTIETRSWRAPLKALDKPLAIASSVNRQPKNGLEAWEWMREQPDIRAKLNDVGYFTFDDLPFGQVLCTVWLEYCASTDADPPPHLKPSPHDGQLGNFSPHRFAWFTSGVVRLALPLPVKGMLGIYQWDAPADCQRHSPFA